MLSLQTLVACFAITGAGQTELLDFTAPWCGPCRQMQPIVDGLAAQGHPVRKVDFDSERALVAKLNVTAIPCFVMLVDGQEVDRAVGATTKARLEQMLARGQKAASTRQSPAAAQPGNRTFADDSQSVVAPPTAHPPGAILRGQSPDAPPSFLPPSGAPAPGQQPLSPAPGQMLPENYSAQPLVTSDPTIQQGPHRQALAAAGSALAESSAAAERCLASSVRLRVEDAAGNSVGSGTIIDAREGEALVLTCGHIFRESKGTGKVLIDLFGPGAPKQLVGQVVGFDLKRDVGLVSFRPGVPVVAARLAPPSYVVKPGAKVINVGCDNGREPTARESHVTSTDKYLPPPNIQVAGQPVEGRSGGGLFTEDGLVIGVCNAADPADNEGLYAGVGLIYGEIARKGLSEMVSPIAAAPIALAGGMPAMARTMPSTDQSDALPQVVPTSAGGARGTLAGQMGATPPLAANEQAIVDKIRAAQGAAEVICIVKPLSDPHAMSQILVVDQASPQLLQQLSAEGHAQAARHLTSLDTPPVPVQARMQPPAQQPPLSQPRQFPAQQLAPPQASQPSRQPIPTSDTWQPSTGIRRYR